MITIPKKIKVTTGQAPFTYLWSSSNSCLTFSKASGTTNDGVIETNFLLASDTCNGVATLTVTSSCGNSQSFTVNYTIPCTSLTIQPIVNNKGLVFEVTASQPGCNSVDFTWGYDKTIWSFLIKRDGKFNSELELVLNSNVSLPSNTQISATVKDCNGCEKTALFTYNIASPRVEPVTVNLYPTKDNTSYVGEVTFTVPTNTFYETLQQKVPSILTIEKTGPLTYKYTVPFQTVNNIPGNINTQTAYTQGTYTIKSMLGIISNTADIKFVYHKPEVAKSINITNGTFNLPCDARPALPFTVDLSNYVTVSEGATIDWTSFMLVAPTPTNAFNVKIVTEASKQYLSYAPNTPVVTDVVNFILKTTDNIISNTGSFTFLPCVSAPTANDDNYTIAANSTVSKNILINDLGNGSQIDPTTVEVTDVQSGLSVTTNPDGTVTITVSKDATGVRRFNYTVKNTSGIKSNVALVSVTVVNAGQNTNVILCD